ncbi:MAG: hypothetical protein ACYC96_09615 [Fimbriimonadaceae bacterium]
MSTTLEGIDARGYLNGWLNGLIGMYVADIKAIPDDKWTATFGGCTRPSNELTADAISLLLWTTAALKGTASSGDGFGKMKELAAELSNKDAAIAKIKEAAADFTAALACASDEQLSTQVTPPWEMPAPLYMIAQIAVSHIWYHDGQLNYVQCLLGDEKIHWMDSH